ADLNLPVEVVGCETLREPDGLAMSSRNRYLSDTERPIAARLHLGLKAAKEVYQSGKKEVDPVLAAFDQVVNENPELAIEYREVRSQANLNLMTDSIE